MLSHLQAHRERRERERREAKQAHHESMRSLMLQAYRYPDSVSDSEWDQLLEFVDAQKIDVAEYCAVLDRSEHLQRASADIMSLRREMALLSTRGPNSCYGEDVERKYFPQFRAHGELEMLHRSHPDLVPRPPRLLEFSEILAQEAAEV